MNIGFSALQPYPFARLDHLIQDIAPPEGKRLLRMSIGEPQHKPPRDVIKALTENLGGVEFYPATRGTDQLRDAQARWMRSRFGLIGVEPDSHVLPVNGTKEALFAIAQALVDSTQQNLVGVPNPFYQLYEGACLLAGAKPLYLNCTPETGFLPTPEQITPAQWPHVALIYLCSPGNPTGAVMSSDLMKRFIERAQEHDVVLVSDECYSEIYPDEAKPPTGLLACCEELGLNGYRNCLSAHSLSKRSNLPGMRSGFMAGDADLLNRFLKYRSYHGSAMPLHHQAASVVAWSDEHHVRENREQYRRKFSAVREVLEEQIVLDEPAGGFFYWLRTPIDDQLFVKELYAREGVLLLPGSFLGRCTVDAHHSKQSREKHSEKSTTHRSEQEQESRPDPTSNNDNPGLRRARMALVLPLEDCVDAARRIAALMSEL
ncbi:MAG: succinyldiaminopimelate transaminase [Pseudomonadota bacterium]